MGPFIPKGTEQEERADTYPETKQQLGGENPLQASQRIIVTVITSVTGAVHSGKYDSQIFY